MVETGRLKLLAERAAVSFPGGPMAIALSGGADSAVVAWMAARAGLSFRAIHVNHGLDGSSRLEAAAAAVATRIGCPLAVVQVILDRDSEGEARRERYAALFSERREDEWLVTGHSADDQAETVMMNLMRASGADGLSGMATARWPLARPLLQVWRSEIREIAALAGLPFVDDAANEDLRHLRNRMRSQLIPEIEGRYNPAFRQSLVQSAAVLAGDRDLLDRMATLRVEAMPGAVRFVAAEVATAEPALAARVIRRAVASARPPHPPSAMDVTHILGVAAGLEGRAVVSGGGSVERRGPWLVVSWAQEDAVPAPTRLEAPGVSAFGRFVFEATLHRSQPLRPLSPWSIVLEEGEPLSVQAANGGGSVAGKRVEVALAEAGIPASLRGAWPVVFRGDDAVWIPGVRRAGWPAEGRGGYLCAVATEEYGWARFEP